jgi:hypothetical protein
MGNNLQKYHFDCSLRVPGTCMFAQNAVGRINVYPSCLLPCFFSGMGFE